MQFGYLCCAGEGDSYRPITEMCTPAKFPTLPLTSRFFIMHSDGYLAFKKRGTVGRFYYDNMQGKATSHWFLRLS
ncbi:unnamed protein product [Phytomonas sp. EM1]|nr:unnamed protein product [Phytomonas sp. EM1]|eukprot:CCW65398.1 unnamed protein product [Phytomonas sp. isolate EM1]